MGARAADHLGMGTAQHAWDCFAEREWSDATALRELMREHLRVSAPHLREDAAQEAADRLAEAALRVDAGLDAGSVLAAVPDAGPRGDGDLDLPVEPGGAWAAAYALVHERARPQERTRHLLALSDAD